LPIIHAKFFSVKFFKEVFFMNYLIFLSAAAALFALYKFLPNRKIFLYFCATFWIIFCISAFVQSQRNEAETVSRAQIEETLQQQQIFSEWYADYQKEIDHLDRNWQLFYSIIANLKTAEIYELSTYEQFSELELDALDEQKNIQAMQVPKNLNQEYAELILEIIKKTQSYVDAQTKTISAVRMAADPEHFKDLKILNRVIKDIIIRQAPAGLFTATEIAAIREMLTVPGKGVEQ